MRKNNVKEKERNSDLLAEEGVVLGL